jgi:AcrR family transcriptional regulator
MPRLSDELREKRKRHILTSAWGCFSRNGFHATSMDDVIAATGMSSSAVYRYFRSKDELIDAAAEEALALTGDLFRRLLDAQPPPSPADTVAALLEELRRRSENPDYDLSRILIQTWAEALRRPDLGRRARVFYLRTRADLIELASRWRDAGYLPIDAGLEEVAEAMYTIMRGMLVGHHLAADVTEERLTRGLAGLGIALSSPNPG